MGFLFKQYTIKSKTRFLIASIKIHTD